MAQVEQKILLNRLGLSPCDGGLWASFFNDVQFAWPKLHSVTPAAYVERLNFRSVFRVPSERVLSIHEA